MMVRADRNAIVVGVALEAVLLAAFVYAAVEARTFLPTARLFPLLVGVLGALVTTVVLGLDIRRALASRRDADDRDEALLLGPFLGQLAWFLAYVVCVGVIGMVLASALFVLGFTRLNGGTRWRVSLAGAGVVGSVLYVLDAGTRIRFPEGLLG